MAKRQRVRERALPERFRDLEARLSGRLLEREDVVKGCVLAMLSRKHLFMLGPPGTAKSAATEMICKSITGARYFEYQLSQHSRPEELVGVINLKRMKEEGIFHRNVKGMLPDAHVAFLDEIWKAPPGILNTLLRQMDGSRRFYNGPEVVTTPLSSAFGASNELPESTELEALYDRFLLRYWVGDLVDDSNFRALLGLERIEAPRVGLTLDQLGLAQDDVRRVDASPVFDAVVELRQKLRAAGFVLAAPLAEQPGRLAGPRVARRPRGRRPRRPANPGPGLLEQAGRSAARPEDRAHPRQPERAAAPGAHRHGQGGPLQRHGRPGR